MPSRSRPDSSARIRFEPDREGLEAVMGPLEAQVMEVVWELGEVTVREAFERIRASDDIAYTTVMTIFHRLHEKGYLERRSQGKAHIYAPRETRKDFQEGVLSRVLKAVLRQARGSDALGMVGKLEKKDRQLLRRMLEDSDA